MTDPLAQIDITINCQDNVGSGAVVPVYTGTTVLVWSQFGIEESNAYRQGGVLRNGIWRGDGGFCPGVLQCHGDFHQSVHAIRASFGVEKWVVGNGINPSNTFKGPVVVPNEEHVRGLNVWRWQGPGFRWMGYIDPSPLRIDYNDATMFLSLIGDEAWARNEAHNGYIKFDLVNMTSQATVSFPQSEFQPDLDGFTYRFEKQDVHHMRLVREGIPVPNNFYPDEDVKRKQDCSIEWNTLKWLKAHNPTLVIPPTVLTPQVFDDVPPTDQFYESINSLGAAGIVVGRP